MRKELMTCTYCGFCKSVCPAFEGIGWDPSVARGRMVLSYGLLQKDIPADQSVVDALYQCTTCKDCERRCPSKVKVVEVVERARKDLVTSGHMLPKHRAVVESVLRYGNPYGERRSVREALSNEAKKAEVGYFAGCTAAYRNPGIGRATTSILTKLGIEHSVVDEVCCGSVLQRIGWNEEDVTSVMRRNIGSIKKHGVKEVLFSCAGCYRMFKEEYPRYVDVPFEVRHISEFLAEKELDLKGLSKVITYHDPCHLGRHSRVYDAPRKLISRIPGASFKEMPRSKETSRCCGGGGGVRSAYPELSSKIAAKRVDEAAFADLLVTTCPFCVNNLNVGKETSNSKARVVDLVELIDELM
ncbi:MAG: (Fe-S)-binding protein [Methanomassiliicoccales archaeon]|nr:MAG: (Fe-S)-binding protein [Methanomassiliicoccales archaeon]